MDSALVIVVLLVTTFVMASGIWVAIALFVAIRRISPPTDSPSGGSAERQPVDGSSSPKT